MSVQSFEVLHPVPPSPASGARPPGAPGRAPRSHALLLAAALDGVDYGVVLVGTDRAVQYHNASARREIESGTWVVVRDGCLACPSAVDGDRLEGALANALRGRRSLIELRRGTETLGLAVVPVAGATDGDTTLATGVLLMFGRRSTCEPLSLALFAREHELTSAESAVLKGLCEGLAPNALAARQRVQLSTVRTQIGSIRAKTGTRSIRELLARLMTLPPVMPLWMGRPG